MRRRLSRTFVGDRDAYDGVVPEDPSTAEADDQQPARTDRMTGSEHAELEAFAAGDLSQAESDPDSFFDDAAVLRGNAMGIIHEGDGSTNAEKVQRLLMLVPALLTVVDEARDTISRLRDIEDRLKPSAGPSIRIDEVGSPRGGSESPTPTSRPEVDKGAPLGQRLFIRAPAHEVEQAIRFGVPGSPQADANLGVTWTVIAVGGGLSAVSWLGESASPDGSGRRDTGPETPVGEESESGGWSYRLSAVKTWLETGTPLA